MNDLQRLISFLDSLEKHKIFFKLGKIRGSILVEVVVPGQRWEIEFMGNGQIEVEKFISTGTISDEKELDNLFKNFSD